MAVKNLFVVLQRTQKTQRKALLKGFSSSLCGEVTFRTLCHDGKVEYAALTTSLAAEGYVREDGSIDFEAIRRDAIVVDSFDDWVAEIEKEAAKLEDERQRNHQKNNAF